MILPADFLQSKAYIYACNGEYRRAVEILEQELAETRAKERAILAMLAKAAHAAENGSAN